MPPDSTETKSKLLAAAFAEFAEHGLAGARVDRIARRAGANKRLLYVYFGNKEQLFDHAIERHLEELANATPFDPADLAGYAGALFDRLLERPELLRMAIWQQLERPDANVMEMAAYAHKVELIAGAQREGLINAELEPIDLMVQLLGLTIGWFSVSPALRALGGADPRNPERMAAYRHAVVTSVGRLVAPGDAPPRR